MKLLFLVAATCLLATSLFAGDDPSFKNEKALVVGVKTNSIEGYGKFSILSRSGDTVIAVAHNSEVLPGMYLITAASKNEIYHKKLWVIDPSIAKVIGLKSTSEVFAMVTGVVDFENYGKLLVNTAEPSYHFASDPEKIFLPGTYLVVGSSNQDLYHQRLVITPQ